MSFTVRSSGGSRVSQLAGAMAKPLHVDRSELFDQHPSHIAVDVDLRTERSRLRASSTWTRTSNSSLTSPANRQNDCHTHNARSSPGSLATVGGVSNQVRLHGEYAATLRWPLAHPCMPSCQHSARRHPAA